MIASARFHVEVFHGPEDEDYRTVATCPVCGQVFEAETFWNITSHGHYEPVRTFEGVTFLDSDRDPA